MTVRLEERLRRDLRAGETPALDAEAMVGAARVRVDRRRRHVRWAGVASALALVVGVAAVIGTRTEPTAPVSTAPASLATTVATTASATTTTSPTGGGLADVAWQPIAPNPLGQRWNAVTVWTGSEAIAWGGSELTTDETVHADGAAYDPATNSWRLIAAGELSPRIDEWAFWSGESMLVLGGAAPDGTPLPAQLAAYDSATDTWSSRAAPPFASVTTADVAVWTGDGIVVWTHTGEAAHYDPVTDTWTPLVAAPIEPRSHAAAVWTGSEVVVWGGESADGRDTFHDGAALDLATGVWRTIAASPLSGRVTSPVWTGREMVIDAGHAGAFALDDGAAYDPATDTWRSISSGPAHPGLVAVWTGSDMVAMAKGTAVIWDAATDTWPADWGRFDGGPTSAQAPLWTGRWVLAFGPSVDAASDAGGFALRPDLVTPG